jgi:hypothetical protein
MPNRYAKSCADMSPRSRGAKRPSCAGTCPRKQRARGRPGARCTRGLMCKMHKAKRTRAYRFSGGSPAFPAQWFYGLFRALPGDRLSCHRRSPRSVSFLGNLTPASGRQDHTTSPSASVHSSRALPRPPHPQPYVRDDRETPLLRAGMARAGSADLPDGESGIFFTRGMDRKSARRANQLPRRASIRPR